MKIYHTLFIFSICTFYLYNVESNEYIENALDQLFKRESQETDLELDQNQDPEYKSYFELLTNEDWVNNNLIDASSNEKVLYESELPLSRNKRFLFDIFKPKDKNKDKTIEPFWITEKPTTRSGVTTGRNVVTQTSISDDPFFKLKQYCTANYDDFCREKKKEIKQIIIKCDELRRQRAVIPEPCHDIVSIYCYVYTSHDLLTCITEEYDIYVPGKKKYAPASTTALSSTTQRTNPSSSRIIIITQPSTPKPFPIITASTPKPIPITPVSTQKPIPVTPASTPKPIPVTPASTPKPVPITPPKPVITTMKPTPATTKNNNELINPFNGPVTSIPEDATKLKDIGQYCLKIKTKDTNCDKMLSMLKDKFKSCEKMPKTDNECQTFKINFCTAFKTFPCCPDVLAGRTCAGKSNRQRRSLLQFLL